MISKQLHKHLWYYTVFALVEGTGVIALFYLAAQRTYRIGIILFMVCFYLLWSLLHHYIHHNVTRKIIIEYLLIGLLGGVIMATL